VEATPERLRQQAKDLYREGQVDAAIGSLRQILEAHPKAVNEKDYLFLCLYFFSSGRAEAAAAYLETALKRWPDNKEMIVNIGVCYSKARQDEKALPWLQRALEIEPNRQPVIDCMAAVCAKLGRHEEGLQYGNRSLSIKDQEAAEGKPSGVLLDRPLPPFQPDAPERNIIAFSLYGDKDRYYEGARQNALLAPHI